MRAGSTLLAGAAMLGRLLAGEAAGAQETAGTASEPARNAGVAELRPPAPVREMPGGMPRPLSVFVDAHGRTCHLYARSVTIESAPETAYATLCRQPNGRWVLVQ